MKTVIGIDLGTQSSKILMYDYEKRRIAARASAPHDLISDDTGRSEQESSWWIDALQKAFAEIPEDLRATAQALAVSGQQHGFVPLDAAGNVIYRVKLWNDTSTVRECRELTEGFGGAGALLRGPGNLILPGYTAGKILWLKKNEPEVFFRLAHILLPHDYLNYLLTGELSMEYGDASGTGLLNIRERNWNRRLCDLIDERVYAMLPKLRSPEMGAGRVCRRAAQLFGIPEGIPVATGGGDNMMAAIGTGAARDGFLTMSLGTSGTLCAFSSHPIIDNEGIIAAFCSSTGGWLPLLCTMNCTVASEKARRLFDVPVSELDARAGSSPPGSEGVVVLPFFSGERAPNLPRARASIMGLNMVNMKRENIIRASMESAIFAMKQGLESLRKLDMEVRRITLTGGGAQSRVWRQMVADITDLPVHVSFTHESAALGAALQALYFFLRTTESGSFLGGSSLEKLAAEHLNQKNDIIEPGRNRAGYAEAYARYAEYLEILKPLYS
ncbi:MAG: xylulokinase [Salinispira sp.]